MTKEKRLKKVLDLIDTLNVLYVGFSDRKRFEYLVDGNSIFVSGLSDDLTHLYLLTHSSFSKCCVYLEYGSKGMELEISIFG